MAHWIMADDSSECFQTFFVIHRNRATCETSAQNVFQATREDFYILWKRAGLLRIHLEICNRDDQRRKFSRMETPTQVDFLCVCPLWTKTKYKFGQKSSCVTSQHIVLNPERSLQFLILKQKVFSRCLNLNLHQVRGSINKWKINQADAS